MSELEEIAACVSTIAAEIAGVVQQLSAQAVRNRQTTAQANAILAGSSDTRPKQVTQQLDTAAQRCEQAAQALQLAEQAAKQFVGRIVGGGGRAEGVTTAPGAAAQSIEQIASWIGQVNDGYSGDPFDPRSSNCGQCALTVFKRLSGLDPLATAALGTLTSGQMAEATERPQHKMTPDEIADALRQRGAGAHCVVGIDRKDAPGHWFNAYFDGNEIVAIDGQSGEVLDWPPTYGTSRHPVVYWDANV